MPEVGHRQMMILKRVSPAIVTAFDNGLCVESGLKNDSEVVIEGVIGLGETKSNLAMMAWRRRSRSW